MAKKAIVNNWCGGKEFIAGQIYSDKECEGMDPRDFQSISVDVKEEAPVEEAPVKRKGRPAKAK